MDIPEKLRVKTTGIRGIYPRVINDNVAYAFARSFAELSGGGPLVVAHDGRRSGQDLKQSVVAGFTDGGCNTVYDLDLAPLPTAQMATLQSDASGAVVITASHNPGSYNGLKLLDEDGEFITADVLQEVKDKVRKIETKDSFDGTFGYADDVIDKQDWAYQSHIDAVSNLAQAGRSLTVGVDAVNASASLILPRMLKAINCNVVNLATNHNESFPHKPEPRPENVRWPEDKVSGSDVDMCVVTDPDGDRLLLIDERGNVLSEELTLPLALKGAALQRHEMRGGVMVTNLSTSNAVDDVAGEFNINVLRSRVGEVNVVAKMKETSACFGGEGNGGVIDPQLHYGRDALAGIVHIVNLMRSQNSDLSVLAKDIDQYTMNKVNVPAENVDDENVVYQQARQKIPHESVDTTDGLRLQWQSGFLHMRPSTTEPLFRIIVEEKSNDQAEQVIEKIRIIIEES